MGAAMKLFSRLLTAGLFSTGIGGIALAQEQAPKDPPATTPLDALPAPEKSAPIAFAGGTFNIAEAVGEEPDQEMVLAYEGKEIARDAFISFNRIAKVGDIDVALFYLDGGGSGCMPKPLMLWKTQDTATLQSAMADKEDCGTLSMAVADDAIYFMPSVMPDAPENVLLWTPQGGARTAGRLSFTPEPGTGWNDLDLSGGRSIVAAFTNEAVYGAAEKLLGDQIGNIATSLLITTSAQRTRSGIFYGSGNKPHASEDGRAFMAVDTKNKALYFAWSNASPEPRYWPALKDWPDDVKEQLEWAFR